MMVYINGAIEMNNKEVERVKCLDVLNAFNIELG